MSHEQVLAATLSPVEPRPEFVRELKVHLLEKARVTLRPGPSRTLLAPRWLWVAAGVGGLLSVVGMAALGARRGRARAARLTTAPPQPQPAQ
jgi:hypothetical protein